MKSGIKSRKLARRSLSLKKAGEKTAVRRPDATHTYYYLHNRGVEQRILFSSQEDFDRFEAYVYLLNSVDSPRAANFFARGREKSVYEAARGDRLVAIAAYSFLPKHFHILATPLVDGGIAKFMQKVQTAYSMYFNNKYMRRGRLFESGYRSSMVEPEALRSTAARVHLLPCELFNTRWETSDMESLLKSAVSSFNYRYSSINEYMTEKFVITDPKYIPASLRRIPDVRTHIKWWQEIQAGKFKS